MKTRSMSGAVVFVAMMLTAGALLASTADEPKPVNAKEPPTAANASEQIGLAVGKLEKFLKTKSMEDLDSARFAMNQVALLPVETISKEFPTRKEQTRMWLKLLAIIERNQDPKFDPNDPKSFGFTNFVRRPDRDPAANEKALKDYHEKSNWVYFQSLLRRIERQFRLRLDRLLHARYKATAADQAELDQLLRESGVSAPRQQKLKELVEGKRKPGDRLFPK